ncbi:MAG: flagellar filament capping protein FliD [Ilumatobacteraceae bacterium]
MSSVSSTGIDTAAIVRQLMDIERQPISAIQERKAAAKLKTDAVGRLKSSVETLRAASTDLLTKGVSRYASSVSNTSAVSASIGTATGVGSVSFTVDQLAQANGLRTGSTVGSTTSTVTSAALLAVSTTTAKVGIGTVGVGSGVAAGSYTVTVTQATTAATRTATAALGSSVTIGPGDRTFAFDVGGSGRSIDLAQGTYTKSELSAAIQAQIDAQGGGATASFDGLGRLTLTTVQEGSAATVRVTNGNTLLGLSNDNVALTGTNGSVKIGTNAEVAVTSAGVGTATVAASTGTGDLTLQISGPLRVGSATVAVVSTGDKSLGAVAAAISGAKVGATATAVKVSDGKWLLQVNSNATGTAAALSLDASQFSTVGGLLTTSAAADAKITVGSGVGAYSITASGNTFADVLPGLTLTATALAATPVTVSVSRNVNAMADAVASFVGSMNSLIADINMQTKYDAAKKVASPLTGDSGIKRLSDQVRAAVTAVVSGELNGLASNVGIKSQNDGTLTFDRAKFLVAVEADPVAVERLFARGGYSDNGLSTYGNAIDTTVAGTYAIDVTTAATRATSGSILNGTPGSRQINVRVGTTVASFTYAPNASAAEVVAGLNTAMSSAGLGINAEVSGPGLTLTSTKFGAAGSFDVNTDAAGNGTYTTYTGADVVGTIDGKAAVGVGQRLRLLSLDTSPARGLEVDVAEGAVGAIGSFTYAPGIAARVAWLTTTALADKGTIATSKNNYETKITGFELQITRFELRMTMREAGLRRQWASVQGVLSTLQSQGDWLSRQMG